MTKNATGNGTILQVELDNFMCHKSLTIDFGPKLNFVTGHNGSGKSAVLTALTVALGGKASFTNRASSISKLLKEGENVGRITVKIRNSGSDAFKPDIYGDVITVERNIVRQGPCGYKLKSKAGKHI